MDRLIFYQDRLMDRYNNIEILDRVLFHRFWWMDRYNNIEFDRWKDITTYNLIDG